MLVAFIGDLFGQAFALFVLAFFIFAFVWTSIALIGQFNSDLAQKIHDTLIKPFGKLFKISEDETEEV